MSLSAKQAAMRKRYMRRKSRKASLPSGKSRRVDDGYENIRAKYWQELLGPEIAERLIREAHASTKPQWTACSQSC